jgi:hypothetical protein
MAESDRLQPRASVAAPGAASCDRENTYPFASLSRHRNLLPSASRLSRGRKNAGFSALCQTRGRTVRLQRSGRPPGSNRARTSRLQPPWCRCACESELKMEIPDKVSRTSAKGSAFVLLLGVLLLGGCGGGGGGGSGTPPPSPAATGLARVNHIVVMMQENHSFDNYFGALPYAPGSPYHPGPCASGDHTCVDGLSCTADASGTLTCANSNPEGDGSAPVVAFHDHRLCVSLDLDHTWVGIHHEINFAHPNNSLHGVNDGFVEQNDLTEQIDTGESVTDDDTMGFYTQADLPYYYSLAATFAVDELLFFRAGSNCAKPAIRARRHLFRSPGDYAR